MLHSPPVCFLRTVTLMCHIHMLISCMYQEEPEHWLIVGLWTEDTVLLQSLSDDQHSCTLDCSDVGQPRSILAAEMHGTWFLFVGTSQGWVVYHAITWQAGIVHENHRMQLVCCLLHADSANKPVMYHVSYLLFVQSVLDPG